MIQSAVSILSFLLLTSSVQNPAEIYQFYVSINKIHKLKSSVKCGDLNVNRRLFDI